ncbi:serine hydrolase [Desulfovibrio sulfodismutans]|uniref:Serine hydrolase n=1 Tax=Desulfolutivibrio sulfodismutans TaxID=63561 RepID=A0A7K3NJB0_9BACT|nr:serine hydrolase [Desulfolutivibrio sulfodismutans]NDY56284.1 serine hydrolase [Desulfolutivibrio sulfodismutans]
MPTPLALLTLLLASVLALAAVPAARGAEQGAPTDTAAVLDGLDAFVDQALGDWQVPGAAVAVVKDGVTVYAKGFGLRDTDKKLPVTPDTVFAIGSCTKAFTAAALALLTDQGTMSLDTPVRDILPGFRMYDDYATAHVTTRDMLLHRTGLPRYDALLALRPEVSREEAVALLRHLPPNKELRAGFEYSNLMYVAAGRLAEVVSGQSWETLVAGRLLAPLGMAATSFSPQTAQASPDFARPYVLRRGRFAEIPFADITPFGPAGSMFASATDMARWLAFHLQDGRVGDEALITKTAMTEMHTPQIITPRGQPNPEIPFGGYGLGWGVSAYRGHLLVLHDGEIDGFKALASFMPDDGIGVVVLTNRMGAPLPEIVAFQIYDRLLGLSPFPWAERAKADRAQAAKVRTAKAAATLAVPEHPAPPTHGLSAYVGVYRHPAFGEVRIELRDAGLAALCGGETLPLVHVTYDMFRTAQADAADAPTKNGDAEPAGDSTSGLTATFHMDHSGAITRLDIPLEPNAADIVFTKVAADPGPSEPAATPGDAPQGATRP